MAYSIWRHVHLEVFVHVTWINNSFIIRKGKLKGPKIIPSSKNANFGKFRNKVDSLVLFPCNLIFFCLCCLVRFCTMKTYFAFYGATPPTAKCCASLVLRPIPARGGLEPSAITRRPGTKWQKNPSPARKSPRHCSTKTCFLLRGSGNISDI